MSPWTLPRYSLRTIALPPLEAFFLLKIREMNRVRFYFDGFNFYNGLKDISIRYPEWKDYYWLDFVRFGEQFYTNSEEVSVKYFTAPPSNEGKRSRQSALFAANRILHSGQFEIIKGNYQNKRIECRKCRKEFEHPEEKRTDVNIAVHMMLDCFHDKVDTLVLVSADSDQVPTIQGIREHFPEKNLKIYFPPSRKSTELLNLIKNVVFLENNPEKFRSAILPVKVESEGKIYTKPEKWKS